MHLQNLLLHSLYKYKQIKEMKQDKTANIDKKFSKVNLEASYFCLI